MAVGIYSGLLGYKKCIFQSLLFNNIIPAKRKPINLLGVTILVIFKLNENIKILSFSPTLGFLIESYKIILKWSHQP
jgi:hypothetical protein